MTFRATREHSTPSPIGITHLANQVGISHHYTRSHISPPELTSSRCHSDSMCDCHFIPLSPETKATNPSCRLRHLYPLDMARLELTTFRAIREHSHSVTNRDIPLGKPSRILAITIPGHKRVTIVYQNTIATNGAVTQCPLIIIYSPFPLLVEHFARLLE